MPIFPHLRLRTIAIKLHLGRRAGTPLLVVLALCLTAGGARIIPGGLKQDLLTALNSAKGVVGLGAQMFTPATNAKPTAAKDDKRLTPDDATKTQAQAAYGRLPISFTVNQGQFDQRVQYSAQGHGYQLYLTPAGVVLALSQQAPERTDDREAVLAAIEQLGRALDEAVAERLQKAGP